MNITVLCLCGQLAINDGHMARHVYPLLATEYDQHNN